MKWLVSAVVTAILNWLAGKLGSLLSIWRKDKANEKSAEQQAEASTAKAEKINKDSTGEEVSAAIDDTLSKL